ncbi:hypothetical protein NMY22_g10849 [Coprinellus aureogranulatus]|nr:hypothetical protein NMY22_g10849 [Coprinellus aureogranulatus]
MTALRRFRQDSQATRIARYCCHDSGRRLAEIVPPFRASTARGSTYIKQPCSLPQKHLRFVLPSPSPPNQEGDMSDFELKGLLRRPALRRRRYRRQVKFRVGRVQSFTFVPADNYDESGDSVGSGDDGDSDSESDSESDHAFGERIFNRQRIFKLLEERSCLTQPSGGKPCFSIAEQLHSSKHTNVLDNASTLTRRSKF